MKPWFQWPESPSLKKGTTEPVVIVGAGLAGSFLAASLAHQQIPSIVIDSATTVASGASGNPVAVVKPFVTREPNVLNGYYIEAFNSLLEHLTTAELALAANYQSVGVLQLVNKPYPSHDFYKQLSASETESLTGFALNSSSLYFEQGGWLNPLSLCKKLLQNSHIDVQLGARVHEIILDGDQWVITTQENTLNAQHVVLATGEQLAQSPYTNQLPIIPARGQLSQFKTSQPLPARFPVITGKNYLINTGESIVIGATFERDSKDARVRKDDHKQNAEGLSQLLPKTKPTLTPIAGYVGIRATTPDRMPLVGPVPKLKNYPQLYPDLHHGKQNKNYPTASYYPGLYVLGGFGSRGLTHAPHCAALLTNYLLGRTNALPTSIHPARFCVANLKRARQPL